MAIQKSTVQPDNWNATDWLRQEVNDRGETVEFPGAKIVDLERGLVYRACAGDAHGGPRLTYLAVQPNDPSGEITKTMVTQLPVSAIARTAYEVGHGVEVTIDLALRNRILPSPGKPNLAELAAAYPHYRRTDLARRIGTSPSTLDNWVRDARAAGYLPPGRRGRPRRTAMTGTATTREKARK